MDKLVLKSNEYISVWSVFLGGHSSLLETLFIIVCAICIRFLHMHPEKVLSCTKFKIRHFANGDISHEANVIVGITEYMTSDCHPEPQSQMYSSLEDICIPQNSTFQNQTYHCHPTYLCFLWYFQFQLMVSVAAKFSGACGLLFHSSYLFVSRSSPCTRIVPCTSVLSFPVLCHGSKPGLHHPLWTITIIS